MNKPLTLALQVEEWTRDAVTLCGDDWKRIAAYIEARFSEMDEADRARITAEASLTLLDPIEHRSNLSTH
ncbi:MAG: hypothetical protein KGJ79_07555 [Alphaproteobacteria bacterium]|nr:hypothetical protein [Alphaproteobacteria bacterium]MDE2493857.1 hypothetical protein [Alphaproteobacteria bacterium]